MLFCVSMKRSENVSEKHIAMKEFKQNVELLWVYRMQVARGSRPELSGKHDSKTM
jgi:hypothetical protein